MMPLTLADIGQINIIRRIAGKPEVKQHLADLGFVPGGQVTVIHTSGGNLIVNIKQVRVALSRELAQKIMIG